VYAGAQVVVLTHPLPVDAAHFKHGGGCFIDRLGTRLLNRVLAIAIATGCSMIFKGGACPDIVRRSDGQGDEIPLRHLAVLLPERQIQPDDPDIALLASRVRMQNLAIRGAPVEAQHSLVRVAVFPASIEHL
jgi:hypothetical protein